MWSDTTEQPCSARDHLSVSDWMWSGYGYSTAHFGEILQGEFTLPMGPTVRGLVTLPYRNAGVLSFVRLRRGDGQVNVPREKAKTADAIRYYLGHYGLQTEIDVRVELYPSITEGVGMGSSTADIVSTLRALDVALGHQTLSYELARMAVTAEEASDSTMLCNRATLFAQRTGNVIENFARPLPSMIIFGINVSPGVVFRTNDNPPPLYTSAQIDKFDHLRTRLRTAITNGDVYAVGEIATESAVINQSFYPKPHLERVIDIAASVSAAGVCVAHSGLLAGLLFDPARMPAAGVFRALNQRFTEMGFKSLDIFHV